LARVCLGVEQLWAALVGVEAANGEEDVLPVGTRDRVGRVAISEPPTADRVVPSGLVTSICGR